MPADKVFNKPFRSFETFTALVTTLHYLSMIFTIQIVAIHVCFKEKTTQFFFIYEDEGNCVKRCYFLNIADNKTSDQGQSHQLKSLYPVISKGIQNELTGLATEYHSGVTKFFIPSPVCKSCCNHQSRK